MRTSLLSFYWYNMETVEEIYKKITLAKEQGSNRIYEDCYNSQQRKAIRRHFGESSDYKVKTYWVMGTVIITW